MPPHSSHKLQPLDVACFGPLKSFYGKRIAKLFETVINQSIKQTSYIIISKYTTQAFPKANILSGSRATGLVPLDIQNVLSTLRIQRKTPPPPPTFSHSNTSFYLGKTPANLYQLDRKKSQDLADQGLSTLVADNVLEKVIKGAEFATQKLFYFKSANSLQQNNEERRKQHPVLIYRM